MEVDGGAPPPRPPAPLHQRLAAALRGPFAQGVDAVLYGFLSAVWLALLAGNVPMVVGRWAGGGPGSAVAAVSRNVSWVAVRALVLLAPAFFPLFAFRWHDRERAQAFVQGQPKYPGDVGGGQATDEVHRPERNEIMLKLAKCVNSITICICIVFGLIIITGILMKQLTPGRGSGLQIIGSLLVDTSFLLCSALSSLIFVPNLALELKRVGVM
ncbi:hypothetical protein U9M48_038976 [Paspalum notatum var. saurae]|uniref:Uncharacterized protein n=1 Tax=Paspalum notatum var. saurae TaxID=547442 RepID=A0AAQ3XAX3_PASNO